MIDQISWQQLCYVAFGTVVVGFYCLLVFGSSEFWICIISIVFYSLLWTVLEFSGLYWSNCATRVCLICYYCLSFSTLLTVWGFSICLFSTILLSFFYYLLFSFTCYPCYIGSLTPFRNCLLISSINPSYISFPIST